MVLGTSWAAAPMVRLAWTAMSAPSSTVEGALMRSAEPPTVVLPCRFLRETKRSTSLIHKTFHPSNNKKHSMIQGVTFLGLHL